MKHDRFMEVAGQSSHKGMAMKWSSWGAVLPGVFALLLYANTLGYDFSYDDRGIILENSDIQRLNWSGILSNSYWNGAGDGLYRPVTMLSYGVNQLLGEEASYYHAVNVLLHAINVVLLYIIVARCLGSWGAFWTALCFAANPLVSEAVASVVGRAELLSFSFGVGGWIIWDYGKDKHRWACSIIAGCFFLFSQLAKETGMVFAVALLVADWKKEKACTYTHLVPIVAICSGLAIKLWAIGALRPSTIGFIDNPLAYEQDVVRIANGFVIYIRYLVKIAYPWPLSIDYSFAQIPIVKPWYSAEVIGVVALLGSALLIVFRWLVRDCFTLRWVFAVGLSIFIVSSIPTASSTIFAERLLYIAVAGYSVLFSILILNTSLRWSRILFMVTIGIYALLTYQRIPVWKEDATLFKSSILTSPHSARSYYGLALSMHRSGQVSAALSAYDKALEIYPKYADAQYNKAALFVAIGEFENAYDAYRDVAEWNPGYSKAKLALALLEIERGESEKGIARLYRLVGEGSKTEGVYESLVLVLLELGRKVEAERVLNDALNAVPGSERLRELRGKTASEREQ